jgi:dihydroxyacid dehydratase/phosphogluconate dehydratase
MSYRSHEILQGPGYANVRALYKADGYAEEELKRPIIGIANAYNSICPGHIVLRQMAERIREGIQAAGGMPIEFGTIGACDGIAMGHEGMRYILPAREMIANDVEAMVQAHRLDGIVLLGSCDKIIPGMLIGAMRVNLPAIFINGGPSLPGHMADGNPYGGEWIDHSCIQQSEGALQAEKITEKEFKWIEDNTLYENLMHAENRSREVIHAIQNPVHKRAGIKILYGNIAPDGAVTKPSAIPEEAVHFCGKAKIYESEESALTGIRNGEVQGGEVVVIRNEGPKGGPGMPEMYKAMKLLVGLGLGSKVCLITDGRFSGSNNGCFVGHICPEAADDGAIAYLQDGDMISVDVENGKIDAIDVDFEERRKKKYICHQKVEGYLYQYAKNVTSASKGAVIPTYENE